MENERGKRITIDELARLMAESFNELRVEMLDGFGTLEKRVIGIERGLKG